MQKNTAEVIDLDQVRRQRSATRQPQHNETLPSMLMWVPPWCIVPSTPYSA
jgi:hypothetical protein